MKKFILSCITALVFMLTMPTAFAGTIAGYDAAQVATYATEQITAETMGATMLTANKSYYNKLDVTTVIDPSNTRYGVVAHGSAVACNVDGRIHRIGGVLAA